MKLTFLEPTGANFSDLARLKLAEFFNLHLKEAELELVRKNEDVVPTVIKHGGWGVVAMETTAGGRYDGPVGSFVQLLDHYESSESCPTTVIAALKMRINFALMVRRGTKIEEVTEILGHEKSYGACSRNINSRGWRFVQSTSNGQAAEDVATKPEFVKAAALGPNVAAKKYPQLRVWHGAFEDEPTATTFYLLGPRVKKYVSNFRGNRDLNMSLLVCRLVNKPGMLAKVLKPFGDKGINLRHIRDFHVGGGEYAHVLHFDCPKNQITDHGFAMGKAINSLAMKRHVLMGPFPVV